MKQAKIIMQKDLLRTSHFVEIAKAKNLTRRSINDIIKLFNVFLKLVMSCKDYSKHT